MWNICLGDVVLVMVLAREICLYEAVVCSFNKSGKELCSWQCNGYGKLIDIEEVAIERVVHL